MDKLDRLGWTAGLSFVSHGSRVGIRTNEASLLDRLSRVLPPGSVASSSPVVHDLYSFIAGSNSPQSRVRRYNVLYAGAAQAARTMDLDETFRALQQHLHLAVAIQSPRRLFVRASVVGWGQRAVVLTGEEPDRIASLVGLLGSGRATYYSSMFAVFDRRGRVHAYPTPLGHGAPGGNVHDTAHRRRHGPRRDRPRRKPLPVGLIAVVRHTDEPAASVHELSPAQAVLALLSSTVVSRLRPQFALETLRRTVAGAGALDIRDRHSKDIVARLIDQLSR